MSDAARCAREAERRPLVIGGGPRVPFSGRIKPEGAEPPQAVMCGDGEAIAEKCQILTGLASRFACVIRPRVI